LWFVSVVAVTLVAGSWLLGQDKKDSSSKGKGSLPANFSKLGLTDEQKQKVYAVQGEFRSKMDDLKKEMRRLEKMQRAEMEKILTDAQKARLREILLEKAPAGATADKSDKADKKADPNDKKN
jgi:hypothetical protein